MDRRPSRQGDSEGKNMKIGRKVTWGVGCDQKSLDPFVG